MASKSTGQAFRGLVRRSATTCETTSSRFPPSASLRQFSASVPKKDAPQYETDKPERPRWSYTPEKMKIPFPLRIRDTEDRWKCNSDPAKLDQFYIKFLGRGGDKFLPEEVKWLAITHKSFDQGRRGFNDRLAFLGRRILNLQTNLVLLHSPVFPGEQSQEVASDGRVPFAHPALDGLANLNNTPVADVLEKKRIGAFATQMGMREILRWRPRKVDRMETSGVDVVLTSAVYAIIGAIALQKGGFVAGQVAREKVLKPMGIS